MNCFQNEYFPSDDPTLTSNIRDFFIYQNLLGKSQIFLRKKVFGVDIIENFNFKFSSTFFRSFEIHIHRKCRPNIRPVTE